MVTSRNAQMQQAIFFLDRGVGRASRDIEILAAAGRRPPGFRRNPIRNLRSRRRRQSVVQRAGGEDACLGAPIVAQRHHRRADMVAWPKSLRRQRFFDEIDVVRRFRRLEAHGLEHLPDLENDGLEISVGDKGVSHAAERADRRGVAGRELILKLILPVAEHSAFDIETRLADISQAGVTFLRHARDAAIHIQSSANLKARRSVRRFDFEAAGYGNEEWQRRSCGRLIRSSTSRAGGLCFFIRRPLADLL